MTLPPDRLGDKGQRYLVRGWIEETDRVVDLARSDTLEGAQRLRDRLAEWPRFDVVFVIDRFPPPPINLELTSDTRNPT